MTEWHLKSRRKKSGGIRKSRNRCNKKLAWKGGKSAMTLISKEDERRVLTGRGDTKKIKLLKATSALVSEKGRTIKGKIIRVKENIANRHFERRQVITKGAIIEVEVNGERKTAIVTNRPGQQGEVQAKAISEKTEINETEENKKEPEKPPKEENAKKSA